MAKKRKLRKEGKLIIALAAVLLAVLAAFVILLLSSGFHQDPQLTGSWLFSEKTEYVFGSNGRGRMILEHDTYDFRYALDENTLKIDFKDETVSDPVYSYSISGDTLTLTGGEGTTGGTYSLTRKQ